MYTLQFRKNWIIKSKNLVVKELANERIFYVLQITFKVTQKKLKVFFKIPININRRIFS